MYKMYNCTNNSLFCHLRCHLRYSQNYTPRKIQQRFQVFFNIAPIMCQSRVLHCFAVNAELPSQTIKQRSILSGEIFKDPSFDKFLTAREQITFSLDTRQTKSFSARNRNLTSLPSAFADRRSGTPVHTEGKVSKGRDRSIATQMQGKEKNTKKLLDKNRRLASHVLHKKIGDYVNCGEKIGLNEKTPVVVGASGKIIKITEKQITLQKTQSVLYYSQANVHVERDTWVERGDPILTLTHQTLITGDIIQGIPRIEQLFEAPHSPLLASIGGGESNNLHESLHTQVREIFRENWLRTPLPAAVRLTLQQLQQILVESIQKVYLSQGVLIADKHIEIVVRQMTCKAELLDGGSTGLFMEELLPIQQIENANLTTPGKKAKYAPAIIGLTRSALEADSFISAASFQETTRVLSRDALLGVSDFLRGLKEKVVIGDLISAGTGLDLYFAYTLLSKPRDRHDVGSALEINHL